MAEAWPSTPIPAVTFMHSTIQSSQNWGVRTASVAATSLGLDVLRLPAWFVPTPAGAHPVAGNRTVNTPNIMKIR